MSQCRAWWRCNKALASRDAALELQPSGKPPHSHCLRAGRRSQPPPVQQRSNVLQPGCRAFRRQRQSEGGCSPQLLVAGSYSCRGWWWCKYRGWWYTGDHNDWGSRGICQVQYQRVGLVRRRTQFGPCRVQFVPSVVLSGSGPELVQLLTVLERSCCGCHEAPPPRGGHAPPPSPHPARALPQPYG